MARKPARLERAGALTPRDRIWSAVRQLARQGVGACEFSIAEVAFLAELHHDTVHSYFLGLTAGGYLKVAHTGRPMARPRRELTRYELVRDTGIEAPRVTADGKPVTAGLANERIWTAAKVLREFDPAQLAATASFDDCKVSLATVKTYVSFLARAGYFDCVAPSKPGTQARYRMNRARYTGPRAPLITRAKEVMDANTGDVVWSPATGAKK